MTQESIKNALLNRDFEQAERLLQAWGKQVGTEIKGAAGDAERRAIFDNAVAFAESSTYLTRVIRAHIATELEANSTTFLYQNPDLEHHRWQVDA